MTSLPPIILLHFTYMGTSGESSTVAFFLWIWGGWEWEILIIKRNLKKPILRGMQICETLKEE